MTRPLAALYFLLACSSVATCAPPARAQGNYRMMPIGGRSVLMGSTGVALGADGAVPLLNPAAVLHVQDSSLALQTMIVDASYRELESWREPTPTDERLDDPTVGIVRVNFVPNGTCFFEDFGTTDESLQREATGRRLPPADPGRNQIALCIIKSDSWVAHVTADNVSATVGEKRTDYTSSIFTDWNRDNYGAAWGIDVTASLALGASAFVVHSSQRSLIFGSAVTEDLTDGSGRDVAFQQAVTASSWDLVLQAGASVRATEHLTLGASVRPTGIHLTDSYTESTQRRGALTTFRRTREGSYHAPTPTRVALGLGFENEHLRAELDGFFYLPLDELVAIEVDQDDVFIAEDGSLTRQDARVRLSDPARPVTNLAAGLEAFVTPHVSLLGGFATDFSAEDPFTAANVDHRVLHSWRDAYHWTLGAGYYGAFGELLFGARLTYGTGQTKATDIDAEPVGLAFVDETFYSGSLVLAGRVNLKAVAKTVGEVISGDDEDDEADDQRSTPP